MPRTWPCLAHALLAVAVLAAGTAAGLEAQPTGYTCAGTSEDVECDGLAASGTGDAAACREGPRQVLGETPALEDPLRVVRGPCVAASGAGNASGTVAASGAGRANASDRCQAPLGYGEDHHCGGGVAASGADDAAADGRCDGAVAATYATNDCQGGVAVSGTGDASADGRCDRGFAKHFGENRCHGGVAVSGLGDASADGRCREANATADGTNDCRGGVAVAGGDASAEGSCPDSTTSYGGENRCGDGGAVSPGGCQGCLPAAGVGSPVWGAEGGALLP